MNPTDLETLRAFYVESRQRLYTYALSLTGHREAAEDAIHGVFQQLLRRPGLPADLRPYAFRAVRNAARDTWRRAGVRRDSIFALTPEAPTPSPPPAFRPDEVERLLDQLTPDERETIMLKIYGGLTFQEIADLGEVPLPTAASWYRRGLDKLKTLLAAEAR
ncbi:MAG TPA: RNA polymerase sigma factor [Opitutaceae bacterium]|nr:RNA polymerase sigma factor [Opitutaceae bacterium]